MENCIKITFIKFLEFFLPKLVKLYLASKFGKTILRKLIEIIEKKSKLIFLTQKPNCYSIAWGYYYTQLKIIIFWSCGCSKILYTLIRSFFARIYSTKTRKIIESQKKKNT